MLLFKNEELINYLTALQVNKSVDEYVVDDSEVERELAKRLDEREDIKLFVKLPGWFEVYTPGGKYNPDWATLKRLLDARRQPPAMAGEPSAPPAADHWESGQVKKDAGTQLTDKIAEH